MIGFGVNLAVAPAVPGRAVAALAEVIAAAGTGGGGARSLLARLDHWRAVREREGFAPIRAAWLARAQPAGTPLSLQLGEQDDRRRNSPGWPTTAACCWKPAAGSRVRRRRELLSGGRQGISAMLLVVDAGNTNVVVAVHDGQRLARHLAHRHRAAAHLATNTRSGC